MSYSLFCILFLSTVACNSTSSQDPSASISPSSTTNPSAEISRWGEMLYQKSYTADDNTIILKVSYFLPKSNTDDLAGIAINTYYEAEQSKMVDSLEEELLTQALDVYQSSNGTTFSPYVDEETYTIVFEDSNYISFLREHYCNTNGPHPNQELYSETFSLDLGKKLELDGFFSVSTDEYESFIIQELLSQAAEKTDMLYENYESIIEDEFDCNQFYLSQNGFVFYFQPYEIAPYAAGVLTFEIPYTTVKDMMEEWN